MFFQRIFGKNTFPNEEKVALVCGSESFSYKLLSEYARLYAYGLQKLDVSPGDRVAVLLPNSIELATILLATINCGLALVPLSSASAPPQNEHILQTTSPKVLITNQELLHRIPAQCLQQISNIFVNGCSDTDFAAFSSLIDKTADKDCIVGSKDFGNNIALISFTSGTTGLPKGVAHTQMKLLDRADTFIRRMVLSQNDRSLLVMPAGRTIGFVCQFLAMLRVGGTVILAERPDSADFWSVYEKTKPSYSFIVPAYLAKIISSPTVYDVDHSFFRFWITGGDQHSLELARKVLSITGRPLLNMFGMTEAGVIAIPPTINHSMLGSIGTPLPGIEMRLVDDKKLEVKPGQVGHLQVRAEGMMAGYWNDGLQPFSSENGWLDTHDLMKIDEDGWYWFMGRASEAIVHQGMNVATAQVREVLTNHPAISEAFLVGVPDRFAEQFPVAFYCLNDSFNDPGEDSLRTLVASYVDSFSVPRRLFLLKKWPLNSQGKIDRASLTRIALDYLGSQK
jgi:acyl-coenzyme A synthetase/AMP-(fatty) acid ligase